MMAQSMSSTETAARPRPLSPEEDAARKTRINNEMVSCFKLPCPVNTNLSIQGIGLYTHVAAQTQGNSNPVFLPIGGPKRVAKDESCLEAPVSEEVDQVWQHVQLAVKDAERQPGQGGMSVDKLKERYGALDAPEQKTITPQQAQVQIQLQRVQEMARKIEKDRAQRAANRQPNSDVDQLTADTVVGGTDQVVGRAIAAPTRANSTTSISEYHENEDPRRMRR
jgi:hypothetical protein